MKKVTPYFKLITFSVLLVRAVTFCPPMVNLYASGMAGLSSRERPPQQHTLHKEDKGAVFKLL